MAANDFAPVDATTDSAMAHPDTSSTPAMCLASARCPEDDPFAGHPALTTLQLSLDDVTSGPAIALTDVTDLTSHGRRLILSGASATYPAVVSLEIPRLASGGGSVRWTGDGIDIDADGVPDIVFAPSAHACVSYVRGTPGPDTIDLRGFPQADCTAPTTVDAGSGDDRVVADPNGAVEMVAGAGNDTFEGSNLDDMMWGGPGNDHAYGGAGDDVFFGDEGNDTLSGGAGRDYLFGGPGNDLSDGGPGNDLLWDGSFDHASLDNEYWANTGAAGGTDTYRAGAGDDTIVDMFGSSRVDAGSGSDSIIVPRFGSHTNCASGDDSTSADLQDTTHCELLDGVAFEHGKFPEWWVKRMLMDPGAEGDPLQY
jgi:hypothetical protein